MSNLALCWLRLSRWVWRIRDNLCVFVTEAGLTENFHEDLR
jgi:hypothetical protein